MAHDVAIRPVCQTTGTIGILNQRIVAVHLTLSDGAITARRIRHDGVHQRQGVIINDAAGLWAAVIADGGVR